MLNVCPNCGEKDSLVLVRHEEEFNIRGEIIPVEVEYYQCNHCQEEGMPLRVDRDPLEEAYREYRRRKGMVQPEEIRDFRWKFKLTQKELSELLGIGIASLSRYENGSLQEQAHDRILRDGLQPGYLLRLIQNRPGVLDEKRRSELIEQLQREEQPPNLLDLLYRHIGVYPPDIESGFQTLHIDKLRESIKYFCFHGGVFKTKLMKLLFYADFKHFKEYGRSITGVRYAHLPYGPVPDQYDLWLSTFIAVTPYLAKEERWVNDNPIEIIISDEPADLSIFSKSELNVLETINSYFRGFTVRMITDFSHLEKGYQETTNGQLIPYHYAQELKI